MDLQKKTIHFYFIFLEVFNLNQIEAVDYATCVLSFCSVCRDRATGETLYKGVLNENKLCKECTKKWKNFQRIGKVNIVPVAESSLIN